MKVFNDENAVVTLTVDCSEAWPWHHCDPDFMITPDGHKIIMPSARLIIYSMHGKVMHACSKSYVICSMKSSWP
jgi:hypothetical protein